MTFKKNLLLGVSVVALGFVVTTNKAMAQALITQDADAVFSATFDTITTVDPSDNLTGFGGSLADGLTVNAVAGGNDKIGTVTISDALNIGGGVTAEQANQHKLIFSGSSNVDGIVGTKGAFAEVQAGADSKVVNFEENVLATSFAVNGNLNATGTAGYVQFEGDVIGNEIVFTADGGVVFDNDDNDIDVTGAVKTGTNNTGSIRVQGDNDITFGMAVGEDGKALKAVTLDISDDTKSTTFVGEVFAQTINVDGVGAVDFAENVTGNIVFDADAIVSVADTKDLTGNITTETTGEGNIAFLGTSTVDGNIGTVTKAVDGIAGGQNTKTLTLDGSVYANKLHLINAGGIVDFLGYAKIADLNANSPAAAVGAAGTVKFNDDALITANNTNALGAVHVLGADKTVTFQGTTFTTAALNVGTDAIFKITQDATVTGATNLDNGTLAIGGSVLTLGNDLTLVDDSTITFTIGDNTGGEIDADSNNVDLAGKNVTLTPTFDGYSAKNGDTYILVDNINTLTAAGAYNVTDTSLVSWGVTENANDITLTATVKSAGSLAGVNTRTAKAVDNAPNDIGAKVQNATTAADVNKAAAQLSPEANNASVAATMSVNNQVGSVVGSRASTVRSGIATGDVFKNTGLWGQFFGFTGKQDKRDNIDGYDATSYGVAFGADAEVGEDLIAGLAFSYASSEIDGKGDTKDNGNDIGSYGLTLYGTKDMGRFYLDSSLGYAYHDYDSTRVVNVLGINQTLKAGYNGNQYSASIGGGMPHDLGDAVVTPWAKLSYSHLNQDAYTETGGTAALKVDSRKTDSFRTGLGFNLNSEFKGYDAIFTPELRAGWHHEFGDDKTDATSRYASGGASFKTEGAKVGRDTAVLGLGLSMATDANWTFSANYDAELRAGYNSHTGTIQARYDF